MPSFNTYRLTWVSLTLGMGYLFMAAPAKHSHCFLPWTRSEFKRTVFFASGEGEVLLAWPGGQKSGTREARMGGWAREQEDGRPVFQKEDRAGWPRAKNTRAGKPKPGSQRAKLEPTWLPLPHPCLQVGRTTNRGRTSIPRTRKDPLPHTALPRRRQLHSGLHVDGGSRR